MARVHAATYAGKRRGRGTIVQAIEVASEPIRAIRRRGGSVVGDSLGQ